MVSIAVALSAQAPLLIVVEDLHWADHSTMEFLDLLVEEVRTKPILLVSAFRPELASPWTRYPNVTSIRLRHLSRNESIDLIDGVTGGRQLPLEIRDHILNKTDGIPLFIEELTKLVLEMDLLAIVDDTYVLTGAFSATAIPDLLKDSLMARLDHLGPAKEAAQLASVLGRTFGHALLLAVSQTSQTKLDDSLADLVESELLYRRGLAPEVIFEFKHALVKDAAYQGLLRSKRLKLHKVIAEIVERDFQQMA
jgi:predicted ATPase